jgi:RNA polymerase sigma factor (sigma-70 family)
MRISSRGDVRVDLQSTTVDLQGLLERFAAGEPAAKEALITRAMDRLSVIARKLLRGFGGESRMEMWTIDVCNEAYPRIAKALDDVKPSSVPQFLGLARLQMHRALLDQLRAREGRDGQRPSTQPFSSSDSEDGRADLADVSNYRREERHRELVLDLLDGLGKMPENEANVVWLKLSGYTHSEIGEIVGVHKDTIDRYWNKACVKLVRQLAPFMDQLR